MTSWLTTGAPGVDVDEFLPERFARKARKGSRT
jgi:hypothetical protein